MLNYSYVTRAKCQCGFIWTTPGKNPPATIDQNIICSCGNIQIENNVIVGTSEPFTEEEFKQAVADEYSENIDDIIITKYE